MVKAFIIHGHAKVELLELKDFLIKIGVQPVVFEHEEDFGDTIIDKFERLAKNCQVAFALLTPDDRISTGKSNVVSRVARQNVLLEMGWFLRHAGRQGLVVLHKKNTEIPSNISGVLYLPFNNSVLEVSEQIRSRLKSLKVKLI
ncbi:MAG: nucleotide-binding protein [Bacteroidetes bacterium]|nr:nucleotide-binding protein [Bacteroidota bacterium]